MLPLPKLMAAGVQIPEKMKNMWAPQLAHSNYRVNPRESNVFNVVLIHHEQLNKNDANQVYGKIRDSVNKLSTLYRFSDAPVHVLRAGEFFDE